MKLATGFFDGVHAGHRQILGGADVALTFRNHPLEVLAPAHAPRLIQPSDERLRAIAACGVSKTLALDFTPELAGLEPEDFVQKHMLPLCPDGELVVRCGANWRFGRDGRGDAALLRSLGIHVEIVPFAEYGGEKVSSTRIRRALEGGRVADANAMLLRPWTVSGSKRRGKGLGGAIGFPTVNIVPSHLQLRIPQGVYAVEIEGARCVANYGVAPTVGKDAWTSPVLEVHVLDGDSAVQAVDKAGDCGEIKVAFLDFLRPERKFPSLDDLKRQIAADCESAIARSSNS